MNIWTFTGNLGRDSEQKFTSTGMAVLSFAVAVKSGYGDKAKTTWVNCAVFGKQAEGRLVEFLKKGTQVCVSGEAYLDEWEKDGINQKMLKVNVNSIDLIGGKPDASPQQQHAQQRPQQYAQNPAQNVGQPQYNAQNNAQQRPTQQRQQPMNQNPPAQEGWDDDIVF